MGTVYYVCNFSTNLRLFQIKSLLKKKKKVRMEEAQNIKEDWCKIRLKSKTRPRLPGTLCAILRMLLFILAVGEGCDGFK